jgi:hypothetical protein
MVFLLLLIAWSAGRDLHNDYVYDESTGYSLSLSPRTHTHTDVGTVLSKILLDMS